MKTNLKLIAIGIIILYCLTPLSAVEINTCDTKIGEQTTDATGVANAHNETKVVNNTDNTDAQTSVEDDVDTKTCVKNDTRDSNSTIATKEVGKTAKDSNNNLTYHGELDMVGYAEETSKGTIKVHCSAWEKEYHSTQNVCGYINVTADDTYLGNGAMLGGKADFEVYNQLKPGKYILKMHYCTNGYYAPVDALTELTVKTEDANLNIKADNVTPTGDATIDVTANEKMDDESVSVKLDSSSRVYDVKITNGEGKIDVHGLKLGKHTVTANYQGSEKFKPGNASATFTVSKYDANLNIDVNHLTAFGDEIIDITADKRIDDEDVIVNLSSSGTRVMKLIDGECRIYAHNLDPGNHTVTATYAGDENFTPDKASTTFTVIDSDPNLGIHVADILKGQNALVEITAKNNVSGNVDVKLDTNTTYHVNLNNGTGSVSISGLKPGNHTATAYFEGNDEYKAAEASTTFAVNEKLDPNLRIHVDDVTPGKSALVEITANKNLSGNVDVKLDTGTTYHVNLNKGTGSVLIGCLKLGNHTATAYFEGNDEYKAANASTTFVVDKFDPNLRIHVDDITPSQSALVEITAKNDVSGNVDVKLDTGNTYHVNLNKGTGSVSISDLKLGNHTATAYFEGNDEYKAANASTTFAVTEKLDPNLRIHVDNITSGQSALVEITAKNDVSGNVDVKLDTGNTYHVNLNQGTGSVSISDLKLGNHTATAYFEGNDEYKAANASTTFAVTEKLNSNLGIHFTNITKVQNALAEVTANKNLSANVDAKLNTCNNPLAVSNSKLQSTTGNNTTTTVNPQTAGQHPLLQA